MRYRSAFTTVDAVIRQLEIGTDSDNNLAASIDTLIATKYANNVARIQELIYEVSEYIANTTGYTFAPYLETQSRRTNLIYRGDLTYAGYESQLSLWWSEQPVITVSSIVWVDTTLTSTQYAVGDTSTYPAEYIAIDTDSGYGYGSSFTDTVDITGIWGYHENPNRVWVSSGDTVQDNPLSASATTLNVTNGLNFEIYQYIRIEDEYLFITARSTNALTVERGVLGTTAAEHAQSTAIDTLNMYPIAEQAARRLVVVQYLNPGEIRSAVSVSGAAVNIATSNDERNITLPRRRGVFRAI